MNILHRHQVIPKSSRPMDCKKKFPPKDGKKLGPTPAGQGSLRDRTTMLLTDDHEFDISDRTADVDVSDRSYDYFTSCASRPADKSGLAGRQLKSCMKVRTQRESLSTILQMKLPSDTPKITEPHEVRFGAVEFREYPRVLSDNPSTSSGPAIGIGWTYNPKDTIVLDLDDYEQDREGYRRTKRELALPPGAREGMLRDVGYSRSEIAKSVKVARKDKDHRSSSVQLMSFDPILEKIDTVKHGVKRIIPSRRPS